MWDRDSEPDAYHSAQLVTIDLDTGEHRFHRPHALCNLSDTHMKFQEGRLKQWRSPGIGRGGRPSLDGSILTRCEKLPRASMSCLPGLFLASPSAAPSSQGARSFRGLP